MLRGVNERWDELAAAGDLFTCYSAALATWAAVEGGDWGRAINPGLTFTLAERGDVFGFAYFPADLRCRLGLRRTGAAELAAAERGVLAEIERRGRAIVPAGA